MKLGAVAAIAGLAGVLLTSACEPPFGLGTPSTRALEDGASGVLDSAGSFEMAGSYTESGTPWTIDLQLAHAAGSAHLVASSGDQKLEAIVIHNVGYFRGRQFLARHLGADPVSQGLLAAAGDGWWTGSAAEMPAYADLTSGAGFRSTFLGPALTSRTDNVSVDGVDAVLLAGRRADVFVAAGAPYPPLRVHMHKGVSADGLLEADLRYSNFGADFAIKAPPPASILDFSNLSTLPPLYTVVSVDTSRCGSGSGPCVVSALVKNLGATQPARAPSSVTFVMTDNASKRELGRCTALVSPNVGYNATTNVQCAILGVGGGASGAVTVTATPTNPGRAA